MNWEATLVPSMFFPGSGSVVDVTLLSPSTGVIKLFTDAARSVKEWKIMTVVGICGRSKSREECVLLCW